MSDTKNPGDKTLHVSPKTLSLKRPVEQGMVRQSFSHGRSKAVVVETVKRRAAPGEKPRRPAGCARRQGRSSASADAPAAGRSQRTAASASNAPRSGVVLRTLSDQERDARANALADARRREEEDRQRQEEEAKRRSDREAREAREREAAEHRKREEDERRRQEDERKRRAEDEARRRLGEEPAPARPPRPTAPAVLRSDRPPARAPATPGARRASTTWPVRPPRAEPASTAAKPGARAAPLAARAAVAEEEEAPRTIRRPGTAAKPAAVPKTPKAAPGEEKRRGRLTLTNALAGEDERTRSLAAFRRRNQRLMGHRQVEQKEKIAREVVIPETITIQELANRMSERGVDVIKLLMKQGQMHKITDVIDADTAQLVAEELGHTVKRVAEVRRGGRPLRHAGRGRPSRRRARPS